MKLSRNEPCSCGSDKKYKNCCGKDGDTVDTFFNRFKLFIIVGFITFCGIIVFGIVEYYQADHPEIELYKCNNPACNQWHKRPVTSN